MDLIELDAASNTQVDSMRELLEGALYAPTAARFKVYIIDEVHMLSRSAFNAMLKTLEEPPPHVKFILATTEPQKIPVTVLSRCMQFNLKQIPVPQIRVRLEQILGAEGIGYEGPALHLIAQAAQGSLRDSLSLLDQGIAFGGGYVAEATVRAMLGRGGPQLRFRSARCPGGRRRRSAYGAGRPTSRAAASRSTPPCRSWLRCFTASPCSSSRRQQPIRTIRILLGCRRSRPASLRTKSSSAIRSPSRGAADLGLAPDEYAGFTMTLLRMLAFAPGEPNSDGSRAEESHSADSAQGR